MWFAQLLFRFCLAGKELKLGHHKMESTFFTKYLCSRGKVWCHKVGLVCTPRVYYNPDGRKRDLRFLENLLCQLNSSSLTAARLTGG